MKEVEKMTAKYIVFEGIDKAGKTTAFEAIYDKITKANLEVEVFGVKEPLNKSAFSNIVPHDYEMIALEMTKQRIPILQYLKKYDVVISDRSFISTYAYQGITEDMRKWIMEINNFIPNPDKVYLFDIDPAIALNRGGKTPDELSFMEDVKFLDQVRQNFLKFKEEYPQIPIEIIDASISKENIVDFIWNDLKGDLSKARKS